MLDCDLAMLEGYVLAEPVSRLVVDAFTRIKTALVEAQKTPTNKQSTPCKCCAGVSSQGNVWYCQFCGRKLL